MLDLNSARWELDGTETAAAHDGEAQLGEALAAWKQGTQRYGKQAVACARAGGGAGAEYGVSAGVHKEWWRGHGRRRTGMGGGDVGG